MFKIKDLKENSFREKLSKIIPDIRIRMQRGMGYIYEFRTALTFGAGLKLFFETNLLVTLIILISLFIGFFIIGYIDLKYLHWMQGEQILSTSTYNPHLAKITDIVKNIGK